MGHAWVPTFHGQDSFEPEPPDPLSLWRLFLLLLPSGYNRWNFDSRKKIVLSCSSFQMGRQAASRWNSWPVILPFVDEFWQRGCFEGAIEPCPPSIRSPGKLLVATAGGGAGREEGRQEAIRMQSSQISSSTSHCLFPFQYPMLLIICPSNICSLI